MVNVVAQIWNTEWTSGLFYEKRHRTIRAVALLILDLQSSHTRIGSKGRDFLDRIITYGASVLKSSTLAPSAMMDVLWGMRNTDQYKPRRGVLDIMLRAASDEESRDTTMASSALMMCCQALVLSSMECPDEENTTILYSIVRLLRLCCDPRMLNSLGQTPRQYLEDVVHRLERSEQLPAITGYRALRDAAIQDDFEKEEPEDPILRDIDIDIAMLEQCEKFVRSGQRCSTGLQSVS